MDASIDEVSTNNEAKKAENQNEVITLDGGKEENDQMGDTEVSMDY